MRNALVTFALGLIALLSFPTDAAPVNAGPPRWEGSVIVVDNLLFDAAQKWNVPNVTFVSGQLNDGDDGIRFIYTRPADKNVGGEAVKTLDDRGFITGCTVSVSDDTLLDDEKVFQAVLIHEVGHCLGVKHTYGKHAGLMATVLNPHVLELTATDRRALSLIYG